MKRILSVGLTTAVLAVLALVGGVGVAAADTPRCVTRAEFYAAEIGMSKGRVHRIFDTDGRLADRMGDGMNRAYKMCSTGQEGVYAEYALRRGVWRMTWKLANAE